MFSEFFKAGYYEALEKFSAKQPKPVTSINFPARELPDLKKRYDSGSQIITTRVAKERNKYQVGQVLDSPLGRVKVVHVGNHNMIPQHPFHSRLSDSEKRVLENHGKYDVVDLVKQSSIKMALSRWRRAIYTGELDSPEREKLKQYMGVTDAREEAGELKGWENVARRKGYTPALNEIANLDIDKSTDPEELLMSAFGHSKANTVPLNSEDKLPLDYDKHYHSGSYVNARDKITALAIDSPELGTTARHERKEIQTPHDIPQEFHKNFKRDLEIMMRNIDQHEIPNKRIDALDPKYRQREIYDYVPKELGHDRFVLGNINTILRRSSNSLWHGHASPSVPLDEIGKSRFFKPEKQRAVLNMRTETEELPELEKAVQSLGPEFQGTGENMKIPYFPKDRRNAVASIYGDGLYASDPNVRRFDAKRALTGMKRLAKNYPHIR